MFGFAPEDLFVTPFQKSSHLTLKHDLEIDETHDPHAGSDAPQGIAPFFMAAGTPRHERPIWIWDCKAGQFVWANGEGIKFWAAQSLEQLQAKRLDKSHPAWVAVAAVFLGNGVASKELPAKGVDLELAFPSGSEVHCYTALCRVGQLKDRSAVIVELTGVINSTEQMDQTGPVDALDLETEVDLSTDAETEGFAANKDDDAMRRAHSSTGQAHEAGETTLHEKTPLLGHVPLDRPTYQMDELARLILEAKVEDETDQGEDPSALNRETPPDPDSETPVSETSERALEIWDTLSLDLTALQGVRDQEEIEILLAASRSPVALVHLHRIIHANEEFVAEFGYGDFVSLSNDGTDWIFPQSRPLLRPFYEVNRDAPLRLNEVRLCSGRKLKRAVFIKPIRLVNFDRVFLLITLDETSFDHSALLDTNVNANEALAESVGRLPLLSAISHEVRTPLNVILGFSELMTREEFGPLGHENYVGYAQDIHDSANHALSLINDLLDFNKLRTGSWEILLEPLELNEVVRHQVHLMRELARRQNIRLRASLEENLALCLADERALRQILFNLISNGIKFSAPGGIVTVSTERQGEDLISLLIEDTGRGMSAGDLQKSLEPFQQIPADNLDDDIGIGTGLGLTIAKALAADCDISFDIESAKGKGTKITLLLHTKAD